MPRERISVLRERAPSRASPDAVCLADHPRLVAHPCLHTCPHRPDRQRALGLQYSIDLFNAFLDGVDDFRIACGPRQTTRRDVLGCPRSQDLTGIERCASGPGHAVRSGSLPDRVASPETASSPRIDGNTAVHMLIVDRELQRLGGNVNLVSAVEFDRERVHVPQAIDGHVLGRTRCAEIGPHIIVEPLEAERGVSRNGKRVSIEIHEHAPARLTLAVDREVHEAGTEVEHPRRMEGPLVALSEDVRRKLLGCAIVIGKEVMLLPGAHPPSRYGEWPERRCRKGSMENLRALSRCQTGFRSN